MFHFTDLSVFSICDEGPTIQVNGLGWGPRACISEKLTGDAAAAGLRTPLWVSLPWLSEFVFTTTYEVDTLLQMRPLRCEIKEHTPSHLAVSGRDWVWFSSVWPCSPNSQLLYTPPLFFSEKKNRKWIWYLDLHPENSVVSPISPFFIIHAIDQGLHPCSPGSAILRT